MPRQRPNPIQWIRYAYGAGLPDAQHEWVYYDTTTKTWALRHLARAVTQIAPAILVLLLFVPGPVWIRVAMVLGGTAMAMLFSFAYIVETTEHRLMKAGYPVGIGERDRLRRTSATRAEGTARRRAKREQRAATRA